MRDPLAWVPIRYKLPLGFLLICLVAFGIGGVVVIQTAGRALEAEIRLRLDEQTRATTLAVERHLALYGRRAEDFASDGYIRLQTEVLVGASAAESAAEVAADLRLHLQENKLPLVGAFVDAAILDSDGRVLLAVTEVPPEARLSPTSPGTSFGPLLAWTKIHAYPTFTISVSLKSLTGGRAIGSLVLLVNAAAWASALSPTPASQGAVATRATLIDPAGLRLPLGPTITAETASAHDIGYETPIAMNGWTCRMEMDLSAAMHPITELRNRYLLIGAALLVVVAAVLFFPMLFLLRPLAQISEAARSIARGDFSKRVKSESRDEIGDLSRAFNIMADAVAERTGELKRAAATLERREGDIRFERDRLDGVIRAMDDGLFILGPDGRVLLSNAAAQPLIRGLEEAGESPNRIDCRHERDAERNCLRCLSDTKRSIRSCVVHLEARIYEVQVTHLPAQGGTSGGRICVSREITGRIAEADQQAHQERLAVMGEIAAVMAHELNNPLAAIAMFSQMLEGDLQEGSEQRESATVIRRNTDACKRSIQGLLDLAAQATPEPGSFDVRDMIEDARELLRPIYQRAGVAVRTRHGAEDTVVFGDEVQLRHVIVNLVMNAVQAFDGAGGEVSVETRESPEAVEIEVRDTGPGVPAGCQSRIFDPFFTTKPPGTGTGLGLPTSRRVVEAHGGRLELLQTGDEGTSFRIRLPRAGTISTWRTSVRLTEGLAPGADVTGVPTLPTSGVEESGV